MPVDLNLPVPGQSPNWANQLNTEIEKINNAINQGVYYASDYGVIGSGSSDDTNTMQNLIDLVPDGSTIVAPPGAIYRTDGWVIENRNVNLDLSNAHLVKTGDNPIVDASGSFDTPVSVASIITNQRYTRVFVPDSATFKAGDIVKVFSDDEIPDSRPRNETEKSWQGEFTVVETVPDASEIRVSPPLLDTYSTNIRVAKLNPEAKVDLRFGTANYPGGGSAGFGAPMFRYQSMAGSSIQGHITSGPGTGFNDRSCAYTVADLRIENLPEDAGYGVACTGSSWGDYRIVANRLRHAFTDDAAGRHAIGQTDPAVFGRAMYCKITGSSAGVSSVPWDTHHGGYGHHFYDITATGTDARWLFRIRGRAHTLSNCIGIGAESGFGIMEESGIPGGAETNGHRFVNCATYRVGQPFNVAKQGHTGDSSIDSVTIEGGRFEFFRAGPEINYGSIRMVNPVLVFTEGGYSYEGPAFFNIVNGRLRGSVSLDATSIPAGGAPTYVIRGSTGGAGTNQVDVDIALDLSDSARHEMTAVMQWNSTRGEVRARIWGNHSIAPARDITEDAATQSVMMTNLNSNTAMTSAWAAQSPPSGGEIHIRSGDPVMTRRINTSGDVTLGAIQPGAFAGQLLDLYVIGSGSATIQSSIGNFNTFLIGGTDKTLQVRDTMRLVWDPETGAWVQLS